MQGVGESHARSMAGGVFVGRRWELEYIGSRAAHARAGRPGVVTIGGAAGVGKTELLRRCVPLLSEFRVLTASCDEPEQSVPFGVITQLIGQLPEELRERHSSLRWAHAGADPTSVAATLKPVLSYPHRHTPVAVLIDDAHWADAESLRSLSSALRGPRAHPVLVLLAGRTDGEVGGPVLDGTWRTVFVDPKPHGMVRLAGLSKAELAQLAERTLRAPLSAGGVAQLYEYTKGNPSQANALLAALQPGEHLLPRPFTSSPLLTDWFDNRLAGLERSSLRLLEAMAVLGTRCRLSLPAQVSDVSDAAAALEPLLDAGLVTWWPAEPSSPVQIRDAMCRDAVYSRISPRRRRELHRVAATLVDHLASWGHRVAAASGPDPALADELETEAGSAIEESNRSHAANCLLWAADLSDTREAYERRLLTGMLHLLRCGHRRRRVERWAPAVHTCSPSALRLCVQGELLLDHDEVGLGQARLTEAVDLAEVSGDLAPVVARAASGLAASFGMRGDAGRAVAFADLAMGKDRVDPATVEVARCGRILGLLYSEGPAAAAGYVAGIGPIDDGDPTVLACAALSRLLAGDLAAAPVDAVLAAGRLASATTLVPMLLGQYLLGRWDAAWEAVPTAVSVTDHGVQGDALPWLDFELHMMIGMLAASRGDTGTAERELELLTYRTASADCAVFPAIVAAALAQASGDFSAMVAACAPVVSHAERGAASRVTAWRPLWLPLRLEGLLGCGQLDQAQRELLPLVGLATELPWLRTVVKWLTGWLADLRGDLGTARDVYDTALTRPARPDCVPLYRARLEQAYGAVLSGSGETGAAVRWLGRARRRYLELRARPLLDRCDADLARAPTQRRAPMSGAPLTEREREVVDLVSSGMTNHQVAARLLVSEKTVEYHLRNVFAKLGIRSRRELRRAPEPERGHEFSLV